jgi:hypothetical protein
MESSDRAQDAVSVSRRPLGWKLVIPCLALSVLALVSVAFYAGWTLGQRALRSAHVPTIAATPSVIQPSPMPPSTEQKSGDAEVPRHAMDADEVEVDVEDFDKAPTWRDRTREIVALGNPNMSAEGAFHLGEAVDPSGRDATVYVDVDDTGNGKPCVIVGRGNGFTSSVIGVCFDLKAKRAVAGVMSSGDLYPQPPPAWRDVEGTVELTSWDWTANHQPIVIRYELFGRRGRLMQYEHGKVVLAR